jgi:hypothetical protein
MLHCESTYSHEGADVLARASRGFTAGAASRSAHLVLHRSCAAPRPDGLTWEAASGMRLEREPGSAPHLDGERHGTFSDVGGHDDGLVGTHRF